MIVDALNHPGPAAGRRRAILGAPVRFGLCDSCRHQRIVRTTRGSVFTLCERSRTDPAYPRYPRVPVLSCAGHEPIRGPGDAPEETGVRPGA